MVSWSAEDSKEMSINSQLSTLSSQLSTLRLLGHFFELRTEHIHVSGVQVTTECGCLPRRSLLWRRNFAKGA